MKALIWKELRENIGWALLAMLALGGAEYYALHYTQNPGQPDFYFNDGITLCRETFLMVTLFGSAAVGLLLGFIQVLPELKRDRWAALLHRPVTRGKFFWGKAMAGVLLYFIGAGVPFLAMVWHVATPGSFGVPFVPAMMLPGLADLASGLAYYFAALLIALQSGSLVWRLIPALAVVHVSYVSTEANLFRVALISAITMSVALCVAGWGAIHARETLRRRPRLGQLALLIVTFYGACGLGDVLKSMSGMAGDMGDSKNSRWEIQEGGIPARIDYVNSVKVATADVHGQPFTDPKFKPERINSLRLGMNTASQVIGDAHGWKQREYPDDYRESTTYMYAIQPYSFPRLEQWFHVRLDRTYVGMLPLEKSEFARLGADGFAPAGAAVPGFAKALRAQTVDSDALFLAAPESLKIARLAKRTIEPIALPTGGPIYGMSHTWANVGNSSVSFQGLVLGQGMAVFNTKGEKAAMLWYHRDVDRWGHLEMGVLKSLDRFVLYYQPSYWIDSKTQRTMPSYVDVMDLEGRVVTAYELPPLPPGINPYPWKYYLAERIQSPAFFFGEMLYKRLVAALGSERLRDALNYQWGQNRKTTLEISRTCVLLALGCAIATFFWARRAQLPPRRIWVWTAAVLVFGIPGLVVFWVAGERPATVPCPTCQNHRRRRIDQETCAHCGAGWPEPLTDETTVIHERLEPA